MRVFAIIGVVSVLCACSQAPRATSDFKAYPDKIGPVLAACAAGSNTGPECANAAEAAAQIRSDQRLARYKSVF